MIAVVKKNTAAETAENKREYLLDVAERLFAEQGFEAVSTRHLASKAGVNVAMLAYYFGSKESLFEAVIKRKMPFLKHALEELRDNQHLTPWEQIAQTIDLYADRILVQRTFCKVILREMSLSQRTAQADLIINIIAANKKIIQDFIENGIQKGFFRQVDVPMTCATLIGTIFHFVNNMAHQHVLFADIADAEDFEHQVRTRLKAHLKDMLRHHLMPIG